MKNQRCSNYAYKQGLTRTMLDILKIEGIGVTKICKEH